jgi:predicted amidohydrolase YtcJ
VDSRCSSAPPQQPPSRAPSQPTRSERATSSPPADLLVVNGRVITLDPLRPLAEAVAVRGERILAVGSLAEARALGGPNTQVVDAEGGLIVPAFHDAHLHLLSYARARARLDCRQFTSLADLQHALRQRNRDLSAGAWLRATGYDETRFVERRHPDRHDLDLAVPDRPVRLQHRSLHLDVLNTAALQLTGLAETRSPLVERDPSSDEPTGRLYHAAELLRGRLPHPTEPELARDVRQSSDRLLAWGITIVQDASVTNGVEEWQLFHRLARRGDLPLHLFVMPGGRYWRDVLASQPPTHQVRLGPVKLVLDEATTDPAELQAAVADVRRAGRAVALHAVSESEVAIALQVLLAAGPRRPSAPPDRLEHGATIAESWLPDLRAAGLMVVGQPSLVYQRGDAYLAEHSPELHGWLG